MHDEPKALFRQAILDSQLLLVRPMCSPFLSLLHERLLGYEAEAVP